jgi:cytochrome c-type biogenesis protein CcmH/NrfF
MTNMSTATILWIVAAVVLVAIVVTLLVVRSRRRAARPQMGLPDLGALSTDGLDKAHAGGAAKPKPQE